MIGLLPDPSPRTEDGDRSDAAPPNRDARLEHLARRQLVVSGPSWGELPRRWAWVHQALRARSTWSACIARCPALATSSKSRWPRSHPLRAKSKRVSCSCSHIEGGAGQYLTITRYNSWQDFGADSHAGTQLAHVSRRWADVRQHSAFTAIRLLTGLM